MVALARDLWSPGPDDRGDPLQSAAGWELLATGIRAGAPEVPLLRAVAVELGEAGGTAVREVAERLSFGVDPAAAWEPALRHPGTADLARAARRSARTGAGLAAAATEIAARERERAAESAQRRSQRAAVWIAGPLGLCFLPAFLCLGVVPVVLGLLQRSALLW
ncbi:type II secretion system F family protein [Saccharopolyspora montiporae]|nr:type II secretion system F family protein [Saccharopolyspora sp. HNM0983]